MRVTPETRKEEVTRLNSVTMTLGGSFSTRSLESQLARSMSGMMWERWLKAPSTAGWVVSGISVILGMRMISRTLATFTP